MRLRVRGEDSQREHEHVPRFWRETKTQKLKNMEDPFKQIESL